MKNLTQGMVLLAALSIPLYAQAKPAPAAAPTTTLAMPAPSPVAGHSKAEFYEFWKNAGFSVSGWGTFNYSMKSTFTKAIDSAYATDGTYISPGFGATLWYGNQTSQIGFSAGYMQIYNNTATVLSQSQTEKLTYIPMVLLARYYIMKGLWAGAGFGYSVGLLKVDNGSAATKTFASPLISVRGGYDYEIMQGLSIGGFLDLSYSFATVNQLIGTSISSAADYTANSFNIMPGISVNYTF